MVPDVCVVLPLGFTVFGVVDVTVNDDVSLCLDNVIGCPCVGIM